MACVWFQSVTTTTAKKTGEFNFSFIKYARAFNSSSSKRGRRHRMHIFSLFISLGWTRLLMNYNPKWGNIHNMKRSNRHQIKYKSDRKSAIFVWYKKKEEKVLCWSHPQGRYCGIRVYHEIKKKKSPTIYLNVCDVIWRRGSHRLLVVVFFSRAVFLLYPKSKQPFCHIGMLVNSLYRMN